MRYTKKKLTELAHLYLSGYNHVAFPDTEAFYAEVRRLSGAPEPKYDLPYFQGLCAKMEFLQRKRVL